VLHSAESCRIVGTVPAALDLEQLAIGRRPLADENGQGSPDNPGNLVHFHVIGLLWRGKERKEVKPVLNW
jgi:hypothetical protein